MADGDGDGAGEREDTCLIVRLLWKIEPNLMSLSAFWHRRQISVKKVVVLLVFLIIGIGNMSESATEDHRAIRGNCSVCFRDMPIRLNGMIKIHGPRQNRCAGSELPPGLGDVDEDSQNRSRTATTIRTDNAVPIKDPGLYKHKILKRIPKGSRHQVAEKLTTILKDVSEQNNEVSWQRLFMFPSRCLTCPKRGGRIGRTSATL